ncbi:MAG: GGDEF domain-containing protein [Thiomicrorhabdus sp.]|nr:GGDEF domain-containing protein [Thiomicrorhabdus sp.]
MRIPRLTKSIFLDQFLFMQGAGVLIGLSFPYFLVWYGFEADTVLHWDFFLATQIAGQSVGLLSFLLISMVIRPHLKLLSLKMSGIAEGLKKKSPDNESMSSDIALRKIDIVSNDEIGVSAKAYNKMLKSLIQANEIEAVYTQFSKVMSENLDVEVLADETLSLLIRSTNIDAGAIVISKKGELKLIASKGILEADSLLEHDVVQESLKKGASERIKVPKNIKIDGVLTHFYPSEVFIEPIEFKGIKLGVLIAATGATEADEHTERLLELFSRSIGLAINNAMTHSKFQHLAAIDGLTEIYNRRFGMDRLKEDFSRAIRDSSSLTVAMVDIDFFKKVNDTYGHLVGDKAIILTTSLIKDSLRDGDIVIRYGGEEFLIILHGADSEDALTVCERIRHKVEDSVLKEGDQQINLSVSIGIAAYPEQPVTKEMELIDMADQALYHAKNNGRNRVVRFGEVTD